MSKRGPPGEGHVRRRSDGSYEARLPIPGRTVPKSFYAKTQAEAIRKRREYRATALDSGLTFDASRLALGEYITRWLADTIAGTVKERSYDRYESMIRVHIVPALGSIRLSKLTAMHLSAYYRKELDGGLDPWHVAQIHGLIKRALKQAVRWKLIAANPAEDVDPPRRARSEAEEIRYRTFEGESLLVYERG